jgi:hypothetical protein
MTHDELLELISLDSKEDVRNALRAVVELHKPVEDNRCEACYREEYFGGRHLEVGKYPCQTIQTIERKLIDGNL